MITSDQFKSNLKGVHEQIAEVCAQCGRCPYEVKIMAVTKAWPAQAAEYALRAGLWGAGESRMQEAIDKGAALHSAVRWEFIGHLQSNKAKQAAVHFTRIASVDSIHLLKKLNAIAQVQRPEGLPILVQVNAGEDPAKFGVPSAHLCAFFEQAMVCTHIRIEGLMTLAPVAVNAAISERCFERLRLMRDSLCSQFKVNLSELSMGMSSDYAQAIRQGSTLIRLGGALYGTR